MKSVFCLKKNGWNGLSLLCISELHTFSLYCLILCQLIHSRGTPYTRFLHVCSKPVQRLYRQTFFIICFSLHAAKKLSDSEWHSIYCSPDTSPHQQSEKQLLNISHSNLKTQGPSYGMGHTYMNKSEQITKLIITELARV